MHPGGASGGGVGSGSAAVGASQEARQRRDSARAPNRARRVEPRVLSGLSCESFRLLLQHIAPPDPRLVPHRSYCLVVGPTRHFSASDELSRRVERLLAAVARCKSVHIAVGVGTVARVLYFLVALSNLAMPQVVQFTVYRAHRNGVR